MKWIVDIKGEIEGDYELIGKYEERPQGEWIEDYTESCHSFLGCHCSICNTDALELNDYPYYSKFCPNCGAYMKGGLKNG